MNSLPQAAKPEATYGDKENDDDQRCDAFDQAGVIMKSFGEKVRDGNSVQLSGVDTKPFGTQKPVEISADSQTDGGPARVTDSGKIG